jgi:hypothetical protein
MKRLHGLVLSSVLASILVAGCSSPSTPALVKEEPECPGFEQGGQKMKGSLRKPVRLRVMRDDEVVATVMLYGKDAKHPTRFLLPDSDEEYSLEFAQCSNERAPQPDDGKDPKAQQKAGVSFNCSEPTVYSTLKHTTKRGDPASMEVPFPAPPSPECWTAPSAPAPTASASASAAATPSAEPAPTAEASASASAEPEASASAAPVPSASAAPTAKPTAKPTAPQ